MVDYVKRSAMVVVFDIGVFWGIAREVVLKIFSLNYEGDKKRLSNLKEEGRQ